MASNHFNAAGSSIRWPLNVVNIDGSRPIIRWSDKFKCFTINGILAPHPLSAVPVERNPMAGEPFPPPTANVAAAKAGGSSNEASSSSSRTKRNKLCPGEHKMEFKIFKFVNGGPEEYLVEHREADTGLVTRYSRVILCKNEQKGWEMSARDYTKRIDTANIVPVLEDPNPPLFIKRSNLGLEERRVGWLCLTTQRPKTGTMDRFYFHKGKKHRSLNEMFAFLIYANRLTKDLVLANEDNDQPRPAEQANATL